MIFSVEDLVELHEIGRLKELFPFFIFTKVETVLDKDKDNIKAQDSTTNEKESPKLSTVSQTEQKTQPQSSATKNIDQMIALQLPPGKLYHFFASHKVRSVFELCVLFRCM